MSNIHASYSYMVSSCFCFCTKLYGMKEYRTKLLIFQHQPLSVLCYSFNSKEGNIFQTVRIIIFYLDSEFSYTVFQSTKTSLPLWESYLRLSIGWMPFLRTSIISGTFSTFVFLSRIIIFLSYVYLPLDYIIWIQIWPFLLIAVIFRA